MNSSMSTNKPSVRSVAEATGLSVATISRVLNKSASVNEKTRLRVLEALKEHGYVMNFAARALATKRTRTIGAIVPTLSYSIFSRFLNSVEQQLAELGYALVVATSGGDIDTETKRARELLDIGTEGLILSGAIHDPALMTIMKEQDIPFVCTSVCNTNIDIPTIGYDNSALAEAAIEYLFRQGHKNICIVHGNVKENDRTALRIEGVKRAAKHLKITVSFLESSLDVGGGVDAAKKFISTQKKSSACLCLSDVIALGMIFEFRRHNIEVPNDISIMGFDDLDWAVHCQPALTTIALPTIAMGKKTAEAMVRYLDDKEPIKTLVLDAMIIERETVQKI